MTRLTSPVNDQDHVQGPQDARITLLEYGDYECPHCGAAYPIIEDLQREFATEMRLVYRHFPLTQIHPYAQLAAEAAEAAGAQNKFWEMHRVLFTHQDSLDDASLVVYAASLRLDLTSFRQALTFHLFEKKIRNDFMSGVRSGVNGTPTFFINDVRYNGAHEHDALFAAIEKAARARTA